jgi:hypothetical protein
MDEALAVAHVLGAQIAVSARDVGPILRAAAEHDGIVFHVLSAVSRDPNNGVSPRRTGPHLGPLAVEGYRSDLRNCDALAHLGTSGDEPTRTFNPKVPGSRPGRPTKWQVSALLVPP